MTVNLLQVDRHGDEQITSMFTNPEEREQMEWLMALEEACPFNPDVINGRVTGLHAYGEKEHQEAGAHHSCAPGGGGTVGQLHEYIVKVDS